MKTKLFRQRLTNSYIIILHRPIYMVYGMFVKLNSISLTITENHNINP